MAKVSGLGKTWNARSGFALLSVATRLRWAAQVVSRRSAIGFAYESSAAAASVSEARLSIK
jgi:hypothetical protein